MEIIKGYTLTTELKNNNSGFAKWGYAKLGGKQFFIKEFLSPIYPLDGAGLSREQIERKRAICTEFQAEKSRFYNVLRRCATGNIVTVDDFFRWENKYYSVSEKIDVTPVDISEMTFEQKILVIKVILHNISSLHRNNIVHGDIKPGNILFKRTYTGMYTAKLIDFDSSFWCSRPPEEELQGDMVYLSPEAFMFMADGETELTTRIDIFALGILFHEYFSGELPKFDRETYDYVFEAVLDDGDIQISDKVPEFFRDTIRQMLSKDPASRPTAEEIFKKLPDGEKRTVKYELPSILTDGVSGTSTGRSRLKSTMRTYSEPVVVPDESAFTEETPTVKESVSSDYFKKPDELL